MNNKNINTFQYFGGKFRKLKTLYSHFPECETFYDLFGGSGCVVANLPESISTNRIYNDLNPYLPLELEYLANYPDELSGARDTFFVWLESSFHFDPDEIYKYKKEGYREKVAASGITKEAIWNFIKSLPPEHQILMKYLAYSGVLMPTKGQIAAENLGGLKRKNFYDVAEKLKGVKFYSKSFDEFEIKENEFAYLDPPYLTESQGYKIKNSDNDLLFRCIEWTKQQKGKVAISCNQNDIERLKPYCEGLNLIKMGTWKASVNRRIIKKSPDNTEYLIANYGAGDVRS